MIVFKIALQANELLYKDYEKMSLISEISMTIENQNGITPLTAFKHSVLPKKGIHHYGFGFVISSVFSSMGR